MANYRVARPVTNEVIFSDRVTGVDRYPVSMTFGKLVCPIVLMWLVPACGLRSELLSGAVAHGQAVDVYGSIEIEGDWFHFCRADIVDPSTGEIHPQIGWIKETLLEGAGA